MRPKMRLIVAAIFAAILVISVSEASARMIWVDTSGSDKNAGTETAPYATIRYALTQASSSQIDTIMVKPGIYNDSLTFDTKAVELRSVRGAKSTVIDGSGFGAPLFFDIGVPTTTVVDGFTIRDGSRTGVAIIGRGSAPAYSSSPEIKNCIIRANHGTLSGGGVRLEYSRADIHNNLIDSNTAGSGGGGIYLYRSAPRIWNNRIQYNQTTPEGFGGGINVYDTLDNNSDIVILNNLIVGNYAALDGGGVSVSASRVLLANNLVYGNRSRTNAYGGGIYFEYGSVQSVRNNIIASN